MSDFDWTDHGTAEDHADRLDELCVKAAEAGRYGDAASLHLVANCIRYLSAKAEVLEKENDAAEQEIDRLTKLASKLDAQLGKRPCQNERCLKYADAVGENNALRDALAEMLDLHSSQHNSPTHAAARAVLRGCLRGGE